MLREVAFFDVLVPSFLLYFIISIVLFLLVDGVVRRLGLYQFTWHPPLARCGLYLCLFAALVFLTRP